MSVTPRIRGPTEPNGPIPTKRPAELTRFENWIWPLRRYEEFPIRERDDAREQCAKVIVIVYHQSLGRAVLVLRDEEHVR